MLQTVDNDVSDRCIEQSRGMPRPNRNAVQNSCVSSVANHCPKSTNEGALHRGCYEPSHVRRQSPEQRTDWLRQYDKWRSDGHDELMLDHMEREYALAEPMHRRDQRD